MVLGGTDGGFWYWFCVGSSTPLGCSFSLKSLSFLLTAVPSCVTFSDVTFCGLSGKTNLVPVIQSTLWCLTGGFAHHAWFVTTQTTPHPEQTTPL